MNDFDIDPSRHPCACPICGWSGFVWGLALSRPEHAVRKLCPRCESYPRDRIVWHMLSRLRSTAQAPTLRVLEFGGAARSYWWKRRLFDYHNVDLRINAGETVDAFVYQGQIDRRFDHIDVVIVSHVFGEIGSLATRSRIIAEAARTSKEDGCLILFDDLNLRLPKHVRLRRGDYFHKQRLGSPILEELRQEGWFPTVVERVAPNLMLAEHELPFIWALKTMTRANNLGFYDQLSLSGELRPG